MRAMKTIGIMLALALGGCGKSENTSGEPPASKPTAEPATADRGNYRDVQGIDGIEVEVPPEAKPMDSIPGFQNADKSFAFVVQTLGSDPGTPAAFRESMKYGVKDWLTEETFDGGWFVTHTTDMGGPPEYSLQMRRLIGDTWYKCSCIVPKQEQLAPVIKACKSLRKRA